MSKERVKKLIPEIKEVAERIENTLNDYRVNYYKDTPYNSKRKIYHNLEQANVYAEKLIFAYRANEDIFDNDIFRVKNKCTLDSICTLLENAINESIEYYNLDIADMINCEIKRIKDKLKSKKVFPKEYEENLNLLEEKLYIDNCFSFLKEHCSELKKLEEIIYEIKEINCVCFRSVTLIELYGIKELLLELEDGLKILDIFKDTSKSLNIILEYISCMINISIYKNIDNA